MTIQESALTESRTLRANYTDRTDVLGKVKALSLLPDDLHVTTDMVASYYEVPVSTIKSVVEDNSEELESNGRRVLQGAELRAFAGPFGGLANLGISPKSRSLAVFTRRAVLNVGQLLRDSDVARQVRTHLLDTEAGQRGDAVPGSFAEALEMAAAKQRALDASEAQTAEARQRAAQLEPAADAWSSLASAEGDYAVRDAAQILSRDPAISTGQKRLFAQLRDLRWIDRKGEPYQRQVDAGRLVRRTTQWEHPHKGEPQLGFQVRVTPKGVEKLRELLAAESQLQVPGGAA